MSTSMVRLRKSRRALQLGGALLLTASLGACSLSDLSMSPSLSSSGKAAEASEAQAPEVAADGTEAVTTDPATPATAPAPVLPPNDLVNGALHRTVPVSDFQVALDYWSTLSMGQWTPSTLKPLTVSATAQWTKPSKVNAYLASFSYDVRDESGASVAHGVETASVSPGYQFSSPYNYSTGITIPELKSTTRVLTIDFRYDVLVQTAPKSTSFYKQTATDTLTVTLQKDAA